MRRQCSLAGRVPTPDVFRLRWRVLVLAAVVLSACSEPRPTPVSADGIVAALRGLQQAAAEVGLCGALQERMATDAIVLAPVPVPASGWSCDFGDAAMALHRVEVAVEGDFGVSAGSWLAADSAWWPVAAWRLQQDSMWTVEFAAATRHPAAARPGLATYAGLGWVRARRKLYQESSRVAMLKADRDMAAVSMDVGTRAAFAGALADSVLDLPDGQLPASGSAEVLARLALMPGVVTWVPVGGAIAAAGDLGYTYGLQTVRPIAPDTVVQSRAYLRIWRAQPDSTWQIALNVQAPSAAGR